MKKEVKSPLISAEDLNEILGKKNIKVFDVRGIWGTNPDSLYEEYKQGHIPTAVFLDWRKEFLEQDLDPNLAQVSSYEEAKESFKNLGINKEDIVILYDDYHKMFAGRIWWVMRYWGFNNVFVLNGGFKYWKLKNLAICEEIPELSIGSFEPVCQKNLRISLEDFLIEKDHSCVLDGRGVKGYKGDPEDPRSGHIPGAISTAYNITLDEQTGLFLEDKDLIELFDNKIPNMNDEKIIVSCGSGYSSTVVMLALAHLGLESRLFDESFAVWKLDPKRPIEQSY